MKQTDHGKHEPEEGWDEFARKNPEAPMTKEQQLSYLNHIIDQQNDYARKSQAKKLKKARPWWQRLLFWRTA